MSRVFISYRHVSPDQKIAHHIANYLNERKHHVFVDTQMLVGTKWVDEIERQIKNSDFFVVLLSKESIRSDMVRREVKLAHELLEKHLTILPIRVAFSGELPYDLGAYLDPIQYSTWEEGTSYESVTEDISAAIESSVTLPGGSRTDGEEISASGVQELFNATEGTGAPLPQADPRLIPHLELDTGTIRLDSSFYVKRKADDELNKQILRNGTTTVVKGPRQMGKSSLLARAYANAKKQKLKVFYLDFQSIDKRFLESLESLLQYIARKLAKTFKTSIKPDDDWDELLGAKDNLSDFIENAILSESDTQTLFLFDETDRVFNFSYRDDFFSTIRYWHNLRATNETWNGLNLVIAHSTEPSLWIQDINQSPFNVGEKIRLDDFSLEQISGLNSKHGSVLKSETEIRELIQLVIGHPYLVRQALYSLVKNGWTVSQLRKVSTDETGPFGDHLRRYVWLLQKDKDLRNALKKILKNDVCEETHFQRLWAAGLIKGDSRNTAHMRCQLYKDYFGRHL